MDPHDLIKAAYYAAQSRRPYMLNDATIKSLIPDGGDWHVVAPSGAACRSVMWGRVEVAYMNPRGQIFDTDEGHIAMAFRAMPVTDVALRAIIVLAEKPENLALIRDIAESVIAYIVQPAPKFDMDDEEYPEPEDAEGESAEESAARIEDAHRDDETNQDEITF